MYYYRRPVASSREGQISAEIAGSKAKLFMVIGSISGSKFPRDLATQTAKKFQAITTGDKN